ncbi:putative uncharacterized protein [Clostridium sp. CAG:307]|nr:putative uncharacterized protein [Clostridium sp. CAG:307]
MKNKTRILGFLAAGVVASTIMLAGCKNNAQTTTNGGQSSSLVTAQKGEKDNPFNIAEAVEKCAANDAETRYYVKGKIKKISNVQYGQMILEDETGTLEVYGSYGADGEKRYSELLDKPQVGDTVLMYATLVTYNSKPEIKSGWIISFEKGKNEFDPSKYEEVSVNDARLKADDSLVKVSGTVAKITYAKGMKPNGIYLVDNTNSIYVYDANGSITSEVKVGNNVTLYGKKTHYILDDEKSAASKYGYKGCNQLVDCVLGDNDKKVNEVNYSWVSSSTVKNIINTPVSEDISTTIYKVNALIKKTPGDGFINYYINDLDEKTGSYVYTQANGSDLSYLEPFDGKICTVYLSAINAKSLVSGCNWRFIPVAVKDENYQFDLSQTSDFVMEYHALPQFENSYEGDPETELLTSVSSKLLGFENATISYTSADENIISFKNEADKLVMHANNYGKTKITITVSYNGSDVKKELEIEYKKPVTYDSINISDVYKKEFGTEVIVKGIVAAGVVNQKAFYLVDETGMIACRIDAAQLATIALGQEIIVKGKFVNNSGEKLGQLHIEDAKILTNLGGNNTYSNKSFEKSTLKNIIDLCTAKSEEATGKVYIVEASAEEIIGQYQSNIVLKDADGNSLQLYTGNSKQYKWLLNYKGTLKFEITVSAWNANFKGAVVAIILEDGTRVCNPYNFSK